MSVIRAEKRTAIFLELPLNVAKTLSEFLADHAHLDDVWADRVSSALFTACSIEQEKQAEDQ